MAPPRTYFSPEQIEEAARLRAGGFGWRRVAMALGCKEAAIQARLDPEFRLRRAGKDAGPRSFIKVHPRMSKEDERRIVLRVPPDTRTRHARLMGDPLPGRSALDRRQAQ